MVLYLTVKGGSYAYNMQFEITYLPRGCLESTNKIGNVGESSYYRIEFQFDKYQQVEKDRNISGSYA